MQIDYDILIAYGGTVKKIDKGAIIFREGSTPYFFFLVVEGEVKVYSTNAEGKCIIQGAFKAGQSFGEPPLLLGKPYPSTAEACTKSVVAKISREKLMDILKDHPDICINLLQTFAQRIYNKSNTTRLLISHTPQEKIIHFLRETKAGANGNGKTLIPYTRQAIADFTALRVETVIRTLLRMKEDNIIDIIDHKIYF